MTGVTAPGEWRAQTRSMTTVTTDWTTAPLTELVDHIVEAHHGYLRRQLPLVTGLLEKGEAPAGMSAVWEAFVEELEGHLWKEEQILFPMIRAIQAGAVAADSHCGGVQNPIRVMLAEHDSAQDALTEMRRLTGGYAGALNVELRDLERDLLEHIRLENEILFPRVLGRG